MLLGRIAVAFLVLALYGTPLHAQSTGSVAGCIVGETSEPLPAPTLLQAWTSQRQFTAVANDKGCYAFETLPADVYTVSASLTGFVTMTRTDVRVEPGSSQQLNFWLKFGGLHGGSLCTAAPGPLRQLWNCSVAVAHVRIDRIDTAVPPNEGVGRGAVVLEVFKRHPDGVPADDRITFAVGRLEGEAVDRLQSNAYAPGNEFVMFFGAWRPESRVFMVSTGRILAVDRAQMVRLPFGDAREMPIENLLAQLRVFAAER